VTLFIRNLFGVRLPYLLLIRRVHQSNDSPNFFVRVGIIETVNSVWRAASVILWRKGEGGMRSKSSLEHSPWHKR
jgi:hypothetical protein